jgi:hypothetical protein
MKTPLKLRLLTFLRTYYTERWIASAELQRKVAATTRYTPQNVGRRLRELENEKLVEVRYIRGHAHYRARLIRPALELARASVEWFEQLGDMALHG